MIKFRPMCASRSSTPNVHSSSSSSCRSNRHVHGSNPFFPTCQVRVSMFLVQLRMLWGTPGPDISPAPHAGHATCQRECQTQCQKESQKECQIECQKECQIEWQNICQKECQNVCQIKCKKECQNRSQIECRNSMAGWGSLEIK